MIDSYPFPARLMFSCWENPGEEVVPGHASETDDLGDEETAVLGGTGHDRLDRLHG